MAFLIGGANSAVEDDYDIENSLRFNSADSSYLSLQLGSDGNRKTWTYSIWYKRSQQGTHALLYNGNAAGNDYGIIGARLDTNYNWYYWQDASHDQSTKGQMRDPSAWYHLVVAVDTTDGTAGNRMKMYRNGVLITDFSTNTQPSADDDLKILYDDYIMSIGGGIISGQFMDGYVAEVAMIDGTQYAHTDFGKFDASGIWKPKDISGLTFGSKGFYLEFKQSGTGQNSSGLGADTSGNDNHFACTNLAATDQCTDTPTNNFATLNPLHFRSTSENSGTFSEGNLKLTSTGNNETAFGSIAYPNSGKWYFEVKLTTIASGSTNFVGVADAMYANGSSAYQRVAWRSENGIYMDGETNTTYPAAGNATFSDDDIIGVFYDADNGGDLYFEVNGTESGLAKADLETNAYIGTDTIMPFIQLQLGSGNVSEVNFGNPSYSISSGNADANGYGNFEYVPTYSSTSYYALCTKNLAEFG